MRPFWNRPEVDNIKNYAVVSKLRTESENWYAEMQITSELDGFLPYSTVYVILYLADHLISPHKSRYLRLCCIKTNDMFITFINIIIKHDARYPSI